MAHISIDHPDYAEMVFYGVSAGQAWKDINFTDPELADPSISGDAANPDLDLVTNLFEYVSNRDPWQPEQGSVITESVIPQGTSHALVISLQHNRNATDASVSYESSSDLHTWTAVTPALVSSVITSSETEQVTVRFPSSASSYFVRVRATRSPPMNWTSSKAE